MNYLLRSVLGFLVLLSISANAQTCDTCCQRGLRDDLEYAWKYEPNFENNWVYLDLLDKITEKYQCLIGMKESTFKNIFGVKYMKQIDNGDGTIRLEYKIFKFKNSFSNFGNDGKMIVYLDESKRVSKLLVE